MNMSGDIGDNMIVSLDEVSRRLQLYLRALWGRSFHIRAHHRAGDELPIRPCLRGEIIYLPPVMAGHDGVTGMSRYRAAAMHAAAHVMFSRTMGPHDLNPRQRLLIELIEDARIEALTMRRFPGLRVLWSSLWPEELPSAPRFPSLMGQLIRALFEPGMACERDFWVAKGVDLFMNRQDSIEDPTISYEIGLRLAHDIGQMRLPMNDNDPPLFASYRDDNEHLWDKSQEVITVDSSGSGKPAAAERRENFLEEAEEGSHLAFAEIAIDNHNDEPEGYHVELSEETACLSFYQHTYGHRQNQEVRYPEWFERYALERAEWCTLREQRAMPVYSEEAVRLIARHHHLLRQMRQMMKAVLIRHSMRWRTQEMGDEFDMDAVIRALIAWRMGQAPDLRIYQYKQKMDTVLSTSLLLDLSESINTPIHMHGPAILTLAREAVLLLGRTVMDVGHTLSVAGFHSNGRHEVNYVTVKDFDEPFDAEAQARLYALYGCGATRMGAAIRHATAKLIKEKSEHRLLIVVTDGEPADIDVFDPDHLIQDTRQAVRQAGRLGVRVFCIGLDARLETTVSRIFGVANHLILDRIERLPRQLTQLFMRFASQV